MKYKETIESILKNKIIFNEDFEFYFDNLKDDMKQEIFNWCNLCYQNKLRGYTPLKNNMKHLYIFFKKIGNNLRIILIKEKNKNFIEINLLNHKNYDEKRNYFGFKKNSYYKS